MSSTSILSPLCGQNDVVAADLEGGNVAAPIPPRVVAEAKRKKERKIRFKEDLAVEDAERPLLASKVEKGRWTWGDVWNKCLCLLVISPIIYSLVVFAVHGVKNDLGWHTKYKDGQVFDEAGRRIFRVAFFGDSLIQFSDNDWGLVTHVMTKLQRTYPRLALDAISTGEGGNQVLNLLHRVDHDVLAHKPDCIVIYFDSDATDRADADEPGTKNRYFDDISQLLRICTRQSPGCVALGGPTLFGELPRGRNSRDNVLDDYVKINAQASAALNVTYFHTRDLFFDNLPSSWILPSGYLTMDGEHHNADGVALVQHVFETWLVDKFRSIAAKDAQANEHGGKT